MIDKRGKYPSVGWGSPEVGSAGLKMLEVSCEMELLGITGELFPHRRSQIPTYRSFLLAKLLWGKVYAHMHVCVFVCVSMIE